MADSENQQFTFDAYEPIRGYPELRWAGKRPFSGIDYYPAQLRETYGEGVDGKKNALFWGDNLQVMSHLLRDYRGQVQLIYVDPPFDSKADYKKRIDLRGEQVESNRTTFEEKQYADIWNNDDYLQFMHDRIVLLRELLSDDGSLYLHCDWHRSHHLRCILEAVFGPDRCHNVISWQRSHAQGNTGQGAIHYGRATDTLFFFSKTGTPVWNPQYVPYSPDVLARDYKYVDESGAKYRHMPCDGPGGAAKGNPYYEFHGVTGYWRYSKVTMQELFDRGEIVVSATGKSLSRKRFLRDAKGTPVLDLWDDLNRISPTSSERVEYPTQKPEALLERIVRASSKPGDLVFDCFMGSGTTQAVAVKLGRRFIGCDINLGAIETTVKRLIQVAAELGQPKQATLEPEAPSIFYAGFDVYTVNQYDIFRNPVQARELLMDAIGIEPIHGGVFDGQKDGRRVKIMPVNQIATRADLNDLLSHAPIGEYAKAAKERPSEPVVRITLVCMGHEPDLAAHLEQELQTSIKVPCKIDIEVLDILRDKSTCSSNATAKRKWLSKTAGWWSRHSIR